jgi:hypothetical protein
LAGVLTTATAYSTSTVGLGTDGWGKASMIGIGVGGAFATWSARRRGRSGDWC